MIVAEAGQVLLAHLCANTTAPIPALETGGSPPVQLFLRRLRRRIFRQLVFVRSLALYFQVVKENGWSHDAVWDRLDLVVHVLIVARRHNIASLPSCVQTR